MIQKFLEASARGANHAATRRRRSARQLARNSHSTFRSWRSTADLSPGAKTRAVSELSCVYEKRLITAVGARLRAKSAPEGGVEYQCDCARSLPPAARNLELLHLGNAILEVLI